MNTQTEQAIFNPSVKVGQPPTQRDVYTWHVTYTDGTSTSEYDEARPDGRGWAEREAKPVQTITLRRAEDETEVESIHVPSDAQPVFFRRRAIIVYASDEGTQSGTLAHCIGWKRGDEAAYLFVRDDGSTLLTSDLQAI